MGLRESRMAEIIQRDIKCFTQGEIGRITGNYGCIIGKGGFGEVYKGVLEDGSRVAVKKILNNVEGNFAKELEVHSKINHKNVVRLIGYCIGENALMIVTEYMSKGNLSEVLHNDCGPVLDIRLKIAVECSEALYYMHSQMRPRVIHSDIKPANILLDDNFIAKISDFGISRLVNTDSTCFTAHVMGSIGYMDPLFTQNGRLTSKSDVYSFGIILLELITKKKASVRTGEKGIVERFTEGLASGTRSVRELFDVEISSHDNMKVLEGVAKLAGKCLRMEMNRRPEMMDVTARLRALRKSQLKRKKLLTNFPRGWWNTPASQNNGEPSIAPEVHVPRSLSSNLCRQFSFKEIKTATSNFDESHLVGIDGYGELYCGVIDEGATKVAIRLCRAVYHVKFFETEIVTLENLHHDHLISLVGHCKYSYKMILVYEYMAGGTLRGRLYGHNRKEPPLTWRQRLEICTGAARALYYLHERSIIHYDLTTKNIFLDDRLVAKVSSPTSSIGHMSMSSIEEYGSAFYHMTMQPTEKSDVYYFGVVLFEVLCARGAWDETLPTRQKYLVECVLNCKKKGILNLIVDPYLEGKIDQRCLNKFVETAEKCVATHGVDRPSITEVVQNLETCLAEQSRGLGDEASGDDGTSHPSTKEHRQFLEKYLSDESGRYGSELWIPDNDAREWGCAGFITGLFRRLFCFPSSL
ncbi:unnamed protein product [Alopecurus aequalis]